MDQEQLEAGKGQTYNADAYCRVVTFVLPAGESIDEFKRWGEKMNVVCQDNMIRRDMMGERDTWQLIGNGIAENLTNHYQAELATLEAQNPPNVLEV